MTIILPCVLPYLPYLHRTYFNTKIIIMTTDYDHLLRNTTMKLVPPLQKISKSTYLQNLPSYEWPVISKF